MPPNESGARTDDPMPETARQIARAVRSGRRTAAEVVQRALRRIEERDGELKTFVALRGEAVAEAEALGRRDDLEALPLAGVPVAVKDNLDVAGLPTRCGSEATRTEPADRDAEAVARLRAAGAIVVGKTALPELFLWGTTDGYWGETRNPRALDRTAGGSSGGSAAAVAAGMVPLALGNDGLGSIRIPAACCGIAGLKLSRGAAPVEAAGGDWYGMLANGPLARTVDDVALAAAVLSGRPDLAPGPRRALSDPARGSAGRRLRVAVSTRPPVSGVPVDPEWAAAAADTARRLRAAGHRAIEADPPYRPLRGAIAIFARWFAGTVDAIDALVPASSRRQLQPRTRTHARAGRWVRRLGWPRQKGRRKLTRPLEAFLARYDALITPVLATPPIPARRWARQSWLANVMANARYAPFPGVWNLVGSPAGAVPVGTHTDGTPLAVQIVASTGQDRRALEVMRAVEEVFTRR